MASVWWSLLDLGWWIAEILIGIDREMRSGAWDEGFKRAPLRAERRLRLRRARQKQRLFQKRRRGSR